MIYILTKDMEILRLANHVPNTKKYANDTDFAKVSGSFRLPEIRNASS